MADELDEMFNRLTRGRGVDDDDSDAMFRQLTRQDRKLAEATEKAKDQGPQYWRLAVNAMPFGGTVLNAKLGDVEANAWKRYQAGEADADDMRVVATSIRQQELRKNQSLGRSVAEGLSHVPAILGEMAVAAPLAIPFRAARLGAIPAAEVALGSARIGAVAAASPSMYVEKAHQLANERGGEWTDPENLAPAFAHGAIQTAILGRGGKGGAKATVLGEQAAAAVSGREAVKTVGRYAGSFAGREVAGLAESEVAEAVARNLDLSTKYGTLTELYKSGGENWKEAIAHAITFGVFAGMHTSGDARQLKQTRQAQIAESLENFRLQTAKLAAQGWSKDRIGEQLKTDFGKLAEAAQKPAEPVPAPTTEAAPTPEKVPSPEPPKPEIVDPGARPAVEIARQPAPTVEARPEPPVIEATPQKSAADLKAASEAAPEETAEQYRDRLASAIIRRQGDPTSIEKMVKKAHAESVEDWEMYAAENEIKLNSTETKYAHELAKQRGEEAKAGEAKLQAEIAPMKAQVDAERAAELLAKEKPKRPAGVSPIDERLADFAARQAERKAKPQGTIRDLYDQVRADHESKLPIDRLQADMDALLDPMGKRELLAAAESMEIAGSALKSKGSIRKALQQKILDMRVGAQRQAMVEGPKEPVVAPESPAPEAAKGGLREWADKAEAESAAELKRMFGGDTMFSGFNPEAIPPLAKYIAAKIIKSGYTIADWTRDATAKFGAGIKPHIDDIWNRALAMSRGEEFKPGEPPKPPEASPAATAPGERIDPTSIKNAVTDAERENRGMRPAPEVDPVGHTFPELRDQAMAKSSVEIDALVAELKEKPRPVTDLEDASLLRRQVEVSNQYDTVTKNLETIRKDGDPALIASLETQEALLSRNLLDLYDVVRKAGTEQGRALNARKMLMNKDFSLERMLVQKRSAKGSDLTASERSDVKVLHDKITELQGKVDAAETMAARRGVEEQMGADKPKSPRVSESWKAVENAWADFKKKATGKLFSTPVDPELIASAANLAKALVKHGVKTLADFLSNARKVSGHDLNEGTTRVLTEAWRAAEAEANRAKVDKSLERMDPSSTMSVSRLAKMLQREAVESGVEGLDAVVKHVHERLQEAIPDITLRETMDAISGFGQYRQLPKGELEAQLRDQRGQLQQLAKIDEMLQGEAPPKTGFEQRTPTMKESEIVQVVNDLKKRGGFEVTDPETQLKSALDGVKTRMTNEIKELEHQVKTGVKLVKGKTELIHDVEATMLKTKLESLREEFRSIFADPALTEAQRVERAIASMEKSEAEYERRLREGDIRFKQPRKLDVAEVETARAKREVKRKEYEELRRLLTPDKVLTEAEKMQRTVNALKTRAAREIANLQEKLDNGDFAPRERKAPVQGDAELAQLRVDLANKKAEFHKALEKDRWRQKSPVAKVGWWIGDLLSGFRSIKTSFDLPPVFRQGGFVAMGRPGIAVKSLAEGVQAMVSSNKADLQKDTIRQRENYKSGLYKRSGLYLADMDGGLKEEVYQSRSAEFVPGVKASARGYTAALNRMRVELFDSMTASLGERVSEAEAKAVANYVNVATGRGNVAGYEAAATAAGHLLFSPRNMVSRFQLALGQPLLGGTMRTRAAIAKEYMRFGLGLATFYAVTRMVMGDDAEFEWDPRSSSFGKVRIGKTWIDPLAGLAQVTTFLSRMGTVALDRFGIQKMRKGKEEWRNRPEETMADFARSKFAPVPGTAVDVLSGKNVVGEKVTPRSAAQGLVTPMVWEDVLKTFKAQDIPEATAMGILALLGMGINTRTK